MTDAFQIQKVQDIIGYSFRDLSLLRSAFTHPSAARRSEVPDNSGLVFLGVGICELISREHIYSHIGHSDPETVAGKLSEMVKKCGRDMKLTRFLSISDSAAAIRDSKKTEDELFLALCAAIYKDGGLPSLRAFLLPRLKVILALEAPELSASDRARERRQREVIIPPDPFSDDATPQAPKRIPPSSPKAAADAIKNLLTSKKRRASEQEEPSVEAAPAKKEKKRTAKKKKEEADPFIEETAEPINEAPTDNERKPFIRDALAPVRLSDEQRRKLTGGRNTTKREESKPAKANAAPILTVSAPEDGNYKSALQEYLQKNIRSSVVMLEYKDEKSLGGYITTEVRLFGRLIAREQGSSKKEAERLAAKSAFEALVTENSELGNWFSELRKNPYSVVTPTETEDHVSRLNQAYQKKNRCSAAGVSYERIQASAKKLFAFAVFTNGEKIAVGEGKTVKEAKQNAAKAAFEALGFNDQ